MISCISSHTKNGEIRTRQSFDFNWKFHYGEVEDAQEQKYDDHDWRTLDLPHDWSIEGTISRENPSGWRGGFFPGGIGWYRKTFQWKNSWKNKEVTVSFDGIYMNSEVWINGHYLGKRPYGYISFYYDLTPYLKRGDNVIAVRVDNSKQPSGRWYTGCGIYRHVWITTTHHVHVNHLGTYVSTSNITMDSARIKVETCLNNGLDKEKDVSLITNILDESGKVVTSYTTNLLISARENDTIIQEIIVNDPRMWSPEDPFLYKVESIVKNGNHFFDKYYTPLGIRKTRIDPLTGFWLNGHNIKLKGVCIHHDAGPVGAAVPDDVLLRRLKLLKEMGCNAIRTSHNPFAPEFYTMCDNLGLMVMDEAFDGWQKPKASYDYGLYFEDWWEKDMTDLIKRDRNHPSVIIWSIGNEVRGRTDSVEALLVDLVHKLDPTRPVTMGGGYNANTCDIAGFNGKGEYKDALKKAHEEHPEWPIIGTEIPHTWQTRGIYRTKTWIRGRDFPSPWAPEKMSSERKFKNIYYPDDLTEKEIFTVIDSNYLSSYDNATFRISARKQWELTSNMDFLMGEFRWTGFDYLGENIWPNRGWHCGVLDLCGFPKDHYYFYQSAWTDQPIVHVLPHWTHPGKENVKIPVMVYTNCEKAELFLNGRSLGIKEKGNKMNLLWYVKYQPGILKATGINNEQVVCEKEIITADEPDAIILTTDKIRIYPDKCSVAHITVEITDHKDVFVPNASNLVRFQITGPGKLIGMDNGDMLDHTSVKVNYRKAFNGKCIAIIQSTGNEGEICIIADSDSLSSDQIILWSIKE